MSARPATKDPRREPCCERRRTAGDSGKVQPKMARRHRRRRPQQDADRGLLVHRSRRTRLAGTEGSGDHAISEEAAQLARIVQDMRTLPPDATIDETDSVIERHLRGWGGTPCAV